MNYQPELDEQLDENIKREVTVLVEHGIETIESCESGEGHPYPYPMIRFHGGRSEGLKALAIALQNGFNVRGLHREWLVIDGEVTGPWWEMTFYPHQDQVK